MTIKAVDHVKSLVLGGGFLLVFLAAWQAALAANWLPDLAPTPLGTWTRAVEIIADPFYQDGPNAVGIFWHLVASLKRVLIGFALAKVIAVPLGLLLGSVSIVNRSLDPLC